MKLKSDYIEYIESVCKKKTIKDLKKIIKFLDNGDGLEVARKERNKKILDKKNKIIGEIEKIISVNSKIKKIDLEKIIIEKYIISRSTFYKYLKEIK